MDLVLCVWSSTVFLSCPWTWLLSASVFTFDHMFLLWHSSNTVYPMINWATGRPPVQPVLVKKCSPYKKKHTDDMWGRWKKKEQIYRSILPYSTHVCARTHMCVWDEAESGSLLWGNFIGLTFSEELGVSHLSYNLAFQFLEENMARKMKRHLKKGQRN